MALKQPWMSFGNKLNLFAWLNGLNNNDVGIVPTDSTPTATFGAKKLGPGSIAIDVVNKQLFMNVGTKTTPQWNPTVGFATVVTLTNTQIKNIRATPVTLVAAPGVGKFIAPHSCYMELVYGGTNAFTAAAGDNLALKWKDGTIAAILQGAIQAFVQATTNTFSKFVDSVAAGSTISVAKANVDNQPLVLHNITAGEIAGNAAADNTMRVILRYSIENSI